VDRTINRLANPSLLIAVIGAGAELLRHGFFG